MELSIGSQLASWLCLEVLTQHLEGSLEHRVGVLKVSFLAFLYDASHKCIQPVSWLTAIGLEEGGNQVRAETVRGERGLDGVKKRASQKSLYSVYTDGDKTRMSGPKERATVVGMCAKNHSSFWEQNKEFQCLFWK